MPVNPTDLERFLERQSLARRAKLERNSERDQWLAIFGLSFIAALEAIAHLLGLA